MMIAADVPPSITAPIPKNAPDDFLRAIYAGYRHGGSGRAWEQPAGFFTAETFKLIAAYRAQPEPGELDGDPFCGCQDWDDIRIKGIVTGGRTAGTVMSTVTFHDTDNGPRQVTFLLQHVGRNWRIADMSLYGFAGRQWLSTMLRRELAAPAK